MQLPSTPPPRVCAVVVTYNPKPAFVENVAAVSAQVDHTVVVDNGSSSETEVHLVGLESRFGCKVIRNRQNLGIAAALNIGVKCAMEAGFDWVATFDQDSRVSDGFISLMLETYRQAPHPREDCGRRTVLRGSRVWGALESGACQRRFPPVGLVIGKHDACERDSDHRRVRREPVH